MFDDFIATSAKYFPFMAVVGEIPTWKSVTNTITCMAAVGTLLMVGGGYVSRNETAVTDAVLIRHDLTAMDAKISAFSLQIEKLYTKIEQLPGVDRINQTEAHLHAIDGRIDALNNKVASDEEHSAEMWGQVQGIYNATIANDPTKRPALSPSPSRRGDR